MQLIVESPSQIRTALHEHALLDGDHLDQITRGICKSMHYTGEAVYPYYEGGQPQAIRFTDIEIHKARQIKPKRRWGAR